MSEQRKKILTMLAEGKINADEADRLLAAIETKGENNFETNNQCETISSSSEKKPKFLPIVICWVIVAREIQQLREL